MLSQAPPPSQAKKSRKRGAECTSNPCRKPRALRCPRAKCLTHCQDKGGCALHEVPVPEVDADGFEYYALHDALAASLAAQGLEVPPPPPPTFPSIQELLDMPAPLPPLPAPSASKTSKHPRITSQLDPIWEQDLHQRAQQEIEDNRDDIPVSKQWVTNCPFFPFFQLADDPGLLSSLGENITKIEVFEDRLQQWIPSNLTHDFSLKSQCHTFIRRFGVTSCHDFDELYDASKTSMCPAHLRYNMKQERNGIHTKLKAKRAHASPAPPSDDMEFVEDDCHAVEVVDNALVTPGSVKALGKCAWEHHSPQHDGKCVQEHSGLTPADRENDAPMLRVYYPQEQLFSLIFGVPFVRATYHANHVLWLNSHNVKAIRNAHERAGCTPEGLWASYLASRRAALGRFAEVICIPSNILRALSQAQDDADD
ncbi:hypothetical protein CY34DRAFT_111007 [Suillus luteus UH-Slu-Lm8-n1]|uniref:Uncharacterized protein n=1 Tax=Suillus luteus UH-Slu-Lm8-n1 TaxID=930992 RepID=A0A0D0ADN2_9AGAM|nr:hypothetical protein CY34DRAFT_111007 [Suillus luteus UH-Slu-Lm8-n1]